MEIEAINYASEKKIEEAVIIYSRNVNINDQYLGHHR